MRNKRVRPCKSPWITSQLKKRLHARDILKLKATRSGNAEDWRKFKKLRNIVNNEIKRAKECHYKHALNEYQGDPRNTWRIVNELMSRKSHKCVISELKLPCGNSIYDSHELSNAFNDHFSSIGPKLANDIYTVLNEDLARVEKWLTANKLTLNASKTEFMLIGSRQRLSTFHNPPSLIIDGAPITQVTSTKSLGVHIDQTLS